MPPDDHSQTMFGVGGWRRSLLLAVAWFVFMLAGVQPAQAFFSVLKYSSLEHGARDVLSFPIPPGANHPTWDLVDAKTLLLTVPDLLALPAGSLDTEQARWIASFQVAPIHGRTMGLAITIGLKAPLLNFRDMVGPEDPVAGSMYRLEIDKPEKPNPTGPAQIQEGMVMPGRDGTLMIFAYTGSSPIQEKMEKGGNAVVRIQWESASLSPIFRPVEPGGLVEKIFVYTFKEQIELEILLNERADRVHFYNNPKAGYYVVEILNKQDIGREKEIKEMLVSREADLANGVVKPLNRFRPLYTTTQDMVQLHDTLVGELYFWDHAKEAEKDQRNAQARAYLDSLLEIFPQTPNREVVDFLKLDLARNLDWKPGWLLSDLESAMARHPNSANHSRHRFLQLQLLNESGRFESAMSMMWDPNLPKESVKLWLERGKTAIGLAHAHEGETKYVDEADQHLQKVLLLTSNKGEDAALADYLLAGLKDLKGDGEGALAVLDGLTPEHLAYLGMDPERMMGIADMYYKYGQYSKAFQYYAMLLDAFPTLDRMAPWALLRAAESSNQISRSLEMQNQPLEASKRLTDAEHLFHDLQKRYPDSDAAVWGQIFQLALEKKLTFKERLAKLDKVIEAIALPNALAEAQLTRAELLGGDAQYRQSIDTLNHLLTLTSRSAVVRRAERLKKRFLEEGMAVALDEGRPEFATLLAESYGADWRGDAGFIQARVYLAEALMQMGAFDTGVNILKGVTEPSGEALTELGVMLQNPSWLATARKEGNVTGSMTREVARVRLAEANRLIKRGEWEGVQILLEKLPEGLLNDRDRAERLRFLAKAEVGRGRFPQAVKNLEALLAGRPMGDGSDYYGYGIVLQSWKGDDKALSAFSKVAEEAEDMEVRALANIRVGDILQRAGDFEGAMVKYRLAAELAPGTPWAKVSKENAFQLEMAMEAGR